jgi:hypothetical protein
MNDRFVNSLNLFLRYPVGAFRSNPHANSNNVPQLNSPSDSANVHIEDDRSLLNTIEFTFHFPPDISAQRCFFIALLT